MILKYEYWVRKWASAIVIIYVSPLKIMYYELLITTEYLKVISDPPVKHGKVCLSGEHYSCEIYFLISASNWDHLQMNIL